MYKIETEKISYFLHETQSNSLIAIDPGNEEVCLYQCKLLEEELNTKLKYIFLTHEHEGHTAGVSALKSFRQGINVFAPK